MDGWTLVSVVVFVGAVVIGVPLVFVLRALRRLTERSIALMQALEEVQEKIDVDSRLEDVSTLEHPGGA